ncbi:TrmH family RNA methyltransferase [Mycoplasma sp. 480]|uniref:TrmH family RNA methyltransferase n=1 Tax=Mycoplasma sp. 480 TaxID=3440155 RepID=UPI003F51787B
MIINSLKNQKIIDLNKLKIKKYRDKSNLYLIENPKIIEEALKQNLIEEIVTSQQEVYEKFSTKLKIKSFLVTEEIIKKLSFTDTPQNIIAVCKKNTNNYDFSSKIVILDNIQDPGNLGTILRNCQAFGFKDIIVKGVDIYNEKVVRSSQGAFFYLNIIQTNDLVFYLNQLKNKYWIYGTVLKKESVELSNIKKNKEKIAIIFGNEGNGISSEIQNFINENIYIKIDFESLNVAIANGIILNHFKENND